MSRTILVVGLPHVSPKIARHYRMLGDRLGLKPVVYSNDATGNSAAVAKGYGIEWIQAPAKKWMHACKFRRLVLDRSPVHVELYCDTSSSINHLHYVLYLRSRRIPIVMWCRGGELLYWDEHVRRKKVAVYASLKFSAAVLYKELYMPAQLDRLHVKDRVRHFFYNRIPTDNIDFEEGRIRQNVLFLNSWRAHRRPEIAVECAIRLAPKFPNAIFTIAGERYWTSERKTADEFRDRVREAGLEDRVLIKPWEADPREYLATNDVFLLPAEHVFLNYTLLEAMERGLVPVVANVEGAEKIVKHGIEGMIADLNADAFTSAVEELLCDPARSSEMGRAARRKVLSEFDLASGVRQLKEIYEKDVWTK